jgi:cytochrome d ubiquinol oxidase subunit II
MTGVMAVAVSAYLAAVYLAGDAVRADEPELEEGVRRRGLAMGALMGPLAVGGLVALRADARPLFDDLTSGAGLAAVLVSAAAGLATILLLRARRYEPARFSAALAVAAVVAGWGIAQQPDLLRASRSTRRRPPCSSRCSSHWRPAR